MKLNNYYLIVSLWNNYNKTNFTKPKCVLELHNSCTDLHLFFLALPAISFFHLGWYYGSGWCFAWFLGKPKLSFRMDQQSKELKYWGLFETKYNWNLKNTENLHEILRYLCNCKSKVNLCLLNVCVVYLVTSGFLPEILRE